MSRKKSQLDIFSPRLIDLVVAEENSDCWELMQYTAPFSEVDSSLLESLNQRSFVSFLTGCPIYGSRWDSQRISSSRYIYWLELLSTNTSSLNDCKTQAFDREDAD